LLPYFVQIVCYGIQHKINTINCVIMTVHTHCQVIYKHLLTITLHISLLWQLVLLYLGFMYYSDTRLNAIMRSNIQNPLQLQEVWRDYSMLYGLRIFDRRDQPSGIY